ncbi:MAG TPA: class I SAM-dependent methyltransferase [Elusimicrobiota bacterium]|nr:class I SAM-dependent methyltransferase [Elusimicrobiota bacterium]
MDPNIPKQKPHSAEFFGEYRDYWWNADFLQLMGKRLEFDRVKTVLDVGCGVGHWGRLLSSVLSPQTALVGIDRESSWIEESTERAAKAGLSSRFRYQLGDATKIPFPENSFDLVTCQTLLIHLKSPREGLREMLRVLRPGGLLLCAEPNNFSSAIGVNNLSAEMAIPEIMDLLCFWYTCERGKEALGLGHNSCGDLIPGYMAELGVENVRAYLSDKAVPLFPPYLRDEQRANLDQSCEWADRGILGWDREEARTYFVAGGGTGIEFERLWALALLDAKRTVQAMKDGRFHTGGGSIFYLISGTKPGH